MLVKLHQSASAWEVGFLLWYLSSEPLKYAILPLLERFRCWSFTSAGFGSVDVVFLRSLGNVHSSFWFFFFFPLTRETDI